ncbi:MAG TPA: BLUF domain-containing protein [Burkholderiales bacterium]|jgi:hypothetical protein|nr:BLUF domain-containing protein [Burkholderiales bacterium]
MLYELVYNSAATDDHLGDDGLLRILDQSRRKNRTLGITGLLLFHRGEFVQLLEGEREAVRELYYSVIAVDERHRGPLVCWESGLDKRGFADWWMGFARAPELRALNHPEAAGFLAGGVASLDLSGPQSRGRRMLLALYTSIGAPG